MPSADTPLERLKTRLRAWVGEKGSTRRVLVGNGAWTSTGHAVQLVVLFFLSPFIVHRLGDSLYGVWEMVASLVGYMGFADLGVRPAVVHFVAKHDARGETDALNRYVNTAFVSFATGGLLVLLVSAVLASVLPGLWHLAEGFEAQATAAILIMGGGFALQLPLNAFSGVIVGKQRFDVLESIRFAGLVVRTTLIVLVLSQGWGLVALALVVAGEGLLTMTANMLAAFRLERTLRFAPRLATREAASRLLRFGGWAMAVIVALQVTWNTDALVIGHAISAVAVTFFAIGAKLAIQARVFFLNMARVVEPASGALHGLGDTAGIQRLFARGARVMLLLAGPVVVYLVVVGRPFLLRWFGPEYAEGSWQVLAIMAFAVVPAIGSAPLAAVYYGTARARPLAFLMALEAALNLGLSLAFVGPWGIEGVAVGTLIPAWLVHAGLVPLLLCRHYGASWLRFLRATYTGPVLAGAATWLALRALVVPEGSYGWPALIGLAVLAVLVYGMATLLVRLAAPGLMGRRETA